MRKVFISYEKHDVATATALCTFLEGKGEVCWMAPRDINAGEDYAGQIVRAVKDSKALVVICSDFTRNSGHVLNEVSIAFDQKIQIIPYSLGFVQLGDSMDYYLAAIHRIVSTDDQLNDFNRIKESVETNRAFPVSVEKAAPSGRSRMVLTVVSAVLLIAAFAFLIIRQKSAPVDAGDVGSFSEVMPTDSVRQDSIVINEYEQTKDIVAEVTEEQEALSKDLIVEKEDKPSDNKTGEVSAREPAADTIVASESVLEPAPEPVIEAGPVSEAKSLKEILTRTGNLSALEGLADYYHVTINTPSKILEHSYLLICSQDGTIKTVLSPMDDSGLRVNLKTGEMMNRIAYSKDDLVEYVKP